jgi:hypothetical protein
VAGGQRGDDLSSDEALIEALKGKYRARLEAVEDKERECQQERARLEKLAACIEELEGKRDTTD